MKTPMRSLPFGALLLGLVACGDDDGDGTPQLDAGPPDAAVTTGEPAPPALPDLGECPAGWTTAEVDGVAVCEPGPSEACPAGQARFPGASGCAPVGAPCPSGDFAEGLPDSGVIYVAPGGTGDGTRAAPFGTMNAALVRATRGTIIAVAKGEYDEGFPLRPEVTVQGACAAETTFRWSRANQPTGAIGAPSELGTVRDVTIRDTDNIGVLVQGGAIRLEGVVVEGAQLFGIAVLGGRLEAEGLVVRATRPDSAGDSGFGMMVTEGGEAVLHRVLVEGNRQIGMGLGGAASVEVEDFIARGQVVGAVPGVAAGVAVEEGASLRGTRVVLEDARGIALVASDEGQVELDQSVIRTVRADGVEMGIGVGALGGRVRIRRSRITDAQGTAVDVARGGELQLQDVVVDSVASPPDTPGWGLGIAVQDIGSAILERVVIHRAQAAGLAVIGTEATVAGDIRVEGRDLTIHDTLDQGISGVGVYVSDRASVGLTRVDMARTTHAALVITDDSEVTLTDISVAETRPAGDGLWGRGVEVTDSAVVLERARFDDHHEVGVLFSASQGTLSDLTIRNTRARGCSSDSCADTPGGIALGVYDGSEVTVDGFLIEGAPLCGVQIARDGALDLSSGSIRDTAIGACVQVDGYDVARLATDVRYENAGTRIETTTHYVPEVGDPLR